MPLATKPKDASRPSEEVARDPKSGKTVVVKRKARSTTVPEESTKPKDVPKSLGDFGLVRDPRSGKPAHVRPKDRSMTMLPKSQEKGDLIESLKPALGYITMQGKGYEKRQRRATRPGHAGIMTEGSAIEEAADDGGAAGPKAAAREDTDDEDAVGVQTGGRGPTEMRADGGNGGLNAGDRFIVEEEATEARPARRLAARRDDATTPTTGVKAPTRDSSERYRGSTDLVVRNPSRDRRDNARGYAADREAPTRESRERDFGGGELVRRDPGRPHPQHGAPRMVPDESILDHMPPFGTGHDFGGVGDVDERLARDFLRREREQQQRNQFALARQHRGGDDHGGQGYQGQAHSGQGYGVHGDMGQGRRGQNPTRTRVVQSTTTTMVRSTTTVVLPLRDDPGDE